METVTSTSNTMSSVELVKDLNKKIKNFSEYISIVDVLKERYLQEELQNKLKEESLIALILLLAINEEWEEIQLRRSLYKVKLIT